MGDCRVPNWIFRNFAGTNQEQVRLGLIVIGPQLQLDREGEEGYLPPEEILSRGAYLWVIFESTEAQRSIIYTVWMTVTFFFLLRVYKSWRRGTCLRPPNHMPPTPSNFFKYSSRAQALARMCLIRTRCLRQHGHNCLFPISHPPLEICNLTRVGALYTHLSTRTPTNISSTMHDAAIWLVSLCPPLISAPAKCLTTSVYSPAIQYVLNRYGGSPDTHHNTIFHTQSAHSHFMLSQK